MMHKNDPPITRILGRPSSRPFFSVNRSHWTQGRENRPGKTMGEARRENRNLGNLLLRSRNWEGTEELAAELMGCTAMTPCLSGACSCCNLGAQRLEVSIVGPPVERTTSELAMVTVINTRRRVRVGNLRGHTLYVGFRRRLVEILDGLGILAVGGFELSLNTAENDRYDPFYAEQCHFFCLMVHKKQLQKALKRVFESNDAVPRPVRIERFDRMPKGLAYAHKNRTQWRKALVRRPLRRYSTRWKPLPSAARVEVALAQNVAGLDANVLAVGFQLVVRNGCARLKRCR